MTDRPPKSRAATGPICLDLSRLVRRVGRGPATGIDRVDQAYFTHFLDSDAELYGLIRTRIGFLVLDRAGLSTVCDDLLSAQDHSETGAENVARHRRLIMRRLRRRAIARTPRWGIARMIRRYLPDGVRYLNVAHANLEPRIIDAVRSLPGGRAIAMIHDTIPLDLPDTINPKSGVRFRRFLANAMTCDSLLANSEQTRADILRHASGTVPDIHVLPLGLTPRLQAARKEDADKHPATFVMLGTIEPRKNHALMLDVWQHFHDTRPPEAVPRLILIGGRGWQNAAVFHRLDTAPFMGTSVVEAGRVDDAALTQILSGATGLLFPSFAEGYGLPPMEAAAIGLPVICTDLAPVRAVLGDYPVYADADDMYQWITAIDDMAAAGRSSVWKQPPQLPTWDAHFDQLRALL